MTTETNTPATETPVTKGPEAAAKGAYKSRRIASRSTGKRVAKDGTMSEAKPAATKATKQRTAAPKVKAGNTFTTVDLAAQHGINAKTLRARIRRNIDRWSPLFKDGEKHVFADNATTRKAVAALLAD